MSYRGLGQTKPGAVDNTARDVGTAVNVGGSLIGGLIGAATGRPPATTETATTPEPYVPDVEAPGGGLFWPIAIGVGVLVVGGVAWMGMQAKLPKVASNRRGRRKTRRNAKTRHSTLPQSLRDDGYQQEEWSGRQVWVSPIRETASAQPWSPVARIAAEREGDVRGFLAMAVKNFGHIPSGARLGGVNGPYVFIHGYKHAGARFQSYTLVDAGGSTFGRVFVDMANVEENPRRRVGSIRQKIIDKHGDTPKSDLRYAEALGERAFKRGDRRIPGFDKNLMRLADPYSLSSGTVSGSSPSARVHFVALMKAWLRGWDKANLAAPVEPNRLTPRQRAALPPSAFVFPSKRSWPLDTPERAYAAIQLLKMGRMGSASDFAKVRNAIVKRHPQVWSMYGKNLSWEKTKRAHAKGIAHRKTSRRKTSRRAA